MQRRCSPPFILPQRATAFLYSEWAAVAAAWTAALPVASAAAETARRHAAVAVNAIVRLRLRMDCSGSIRAD
jgi:hypothetical protein